MEQIYRIKKSALAYKNLSTHLLPISHIHEELLSLHLKHFP